MGKKLCVKLLLKMEKVIKVLVIRKSIHPEHIKLIKKGKFIPGLFNDCTDKKKSCRKNRIRK